VTILNGKKKEGKKKKKKNTLIKSIECRERPGSRVDIDKCGTLIQVDCILIKVHPNASSNASKLIQRGRKAIDCVAR